MTESRVQRVGTYALITAEGQVLLSLLNRGPNRGKWALIGGGIEFGESPKDALLREIKEEAGIEIQVDPVLLEVSSHQHRFTEPDGSFKDMHFIGIIHRVELPHVVSCKADGDGFRCKESIPQF